jgi:hypothetical protein
VSSFEKLRPRSVDAEHLRKRATYRSPRSRFSSSTGCSGGAGENARSLVGDATPGLDATAGPPFFAWRFLSYVDILMSAKRTANGIGRNYHGFRACCLGCPIIFRHIALKRKVRIRGRNKVSCLCRCAKVLGGHELTRAAYVETSPEPINPLKFRL